MNDSRPYPRHIDDIVSGEPLIEGEPSPRARHIASVLSKVRYTRRKVRWSVYAFNPSYPFRTASWDRILAHTSVDGANGEGTVVIQTSSMSVHPDMDDEMIVRLALRVLENLEIHECREHFYFDGIKVFDPHANEPKTPTKY
jgi:hypothetical protein